uniref:Uncharacterized protein n=1 Tax=Micrurus surinamensis TaxID=129470 RepID=A0A2D4PPC5_MICSU
MANRFEKATVKHLYCQAFTKFLNILCSTMVQNHATLKRRITQDQIIFTPNTEIKNIIRVLGMPYPSIRDTTIKVQLFLVQKHLILSRAMVLSPKLLYNLVILLVLLPYIYTSEFRPLPIQPLSQDSVVGIKLRKGAYYI